jgi:DNA-3-methyladenine glycosylase II
MISSLNREFLEQGVNYLCSVDPDLARIHTEWGVPPLWARPPGFPTLVHIILEQQVSLASAKAAMTKLQAALPDVSPSTFLTLSDDHLKQIGFSRQKTAYCRGLAQAILSNDLDLDHLAALDDLAARTTLIQIKGIGPWTADIYLLMALLRPDIWPVGDLALITALREVKGLEFRPSQETMEHITHTWRPWRAVAARLLWLYYLRPR